MPVGDITRPQRWIFLLLFFLCLLFALLFANPPDPSSQLTGLITSGLPRSVLLLTAHPDDEAMFFSPTILSLLKTGWDVEGLCLSTGDGDRLGDTRRKELVESYVALGVPPTRVHVVDHPSLQDGMKTQWTSETILGVLEDYLIEHPVSIIITFDSRGITRHPNHISISRSTLDLSTSRSSRRSTSTSSSPAILHLQSPSLMTKFTGPFSAVLQSAYAHYISRRDQLSASQTLQTEATDAMTDTGHSFNKDSIVLVSNPGEWWRGIRAMSRHRSQLVWFRWLYLGSSKLMWINELVVVA